MNEHGIIHTFLWKFEAITEKVEATMEDFTWNIAVHSVYMSKILPICFFVVFVVVAFVLFYCFVPLFLFLLFFICLISGKCLISGLRYYSISNLIKTCLIFVMSWRYRIEPRTKKVRTCQPLKFCHWKLNSIL